MDPGWRIVVGLTGVLLLLLLACPGSVGPGPGRRSLATRRPALPAGGISAPPYRQGQDSGLHRQASLPTQCADPERAGAAYRLRRAPPAPVGALEPDQNGFVRGEGPDRPLRPLLPLHSPLAARAPPSS